MLRSYKSWMQLLSGAAVGALVLASGSALAQSPRPATPAAPNAPAGAPPGAPPPGPISLIGMSADWVKVCGKDPAAQKEVCYTTRDFGTEQEQQPVLAMAVYDIKGEKQRIIRFLMPIGLMLKPGFRFSIDKGPALSGNFEICFPNGCFAEAKVEQATIDAMKKGQTLSVSVQNQGNSDVTFLLPIKEFAKAFDGPPIDPKVLEEQQLQADQKLRQDMEKQVEEQRKALGAQSGAAATPAAGAAPAAPSPAQAPAANAPKR